MAFYQLTTTQKIPTTIDEIWDFISSPANLKDITPEHMGFVVTGPLLGIKLNWVTEITHVRDKEYFVDEQRIGPYAMWHHEHKIEAIAGGVLMTDIITYQPPFGVIGAIANALFIKKQLKEIFDYRKLALEKKYGTYSQ